MGLDKKLQIQELYELKHRNDELANPPFDVENNLLKKSLSGHMYENDNMNSYLNRFQKLLYVIVNQMYIMKNFKNFMVSKYYDKHSD